MNQIASASIPLFVHLLINSKLSGCHNSATTGQINFKSSSLKTSRPVDVQLYGNLPMWGQHGCIYGHKKVQWNLVDVGTWQAHSGFTPNQFHTNLLAYTYTILWSFTHLDHMNMLTEMINYLVYKAGDPPVISLLMLLTQMINKATISYINWSYIRVGEAYWFDVISKFILMSYWCTFSILTIVLK